MVATCFSLWMLSTPIPRVVAPVYIPTNSKFDPFFISTMSTSALVFHLLFCTLAILTRLRWNFKSVLICISLTSKDVKNFLKNISFFCCFLLWEHSLNSYTICNRVTWFLDSTYEFWVAIFYCSRQAFARAVNQLTNHDAEIYY